MKEHDWNKVGIITGKVYMPYSAFIFDVRKDGQEITIAGWHLGGDINMGDYLILPNGNEITRYKITKIETKADSSRMFFIECDYAPRR